MGCLTGGGLPQVMAVFEGCTGVQDNVHFDDQLVAGVVGLQALDLLDGLGEAHG